MKDLDIETDNICVLGCDGTSNNTGWKEGSMAHIENELGWPCQRIVCLLHHCELPLRKMFEVVDGQTTGPNTFCGPIGKMISANVWEEALVEFEPLGIDGFTNLDSEVTEKLSSDAKYLYKLCKIVNDGVDEHNHDFLFNKIGPLCHSRWLTLASRVLRKYISMGNQCTLNKKIRLLAKYIVGVYWKMHIQVKYENTIMDGASILFQEIQSQKTLFKDSEELQVLQQSVQQNCYFAHPENVLLAMLGDNGKIVRAKAVKLITKIRRTGSSSTDSSQSPNPSVREFHLPQLNFGAESYIDMITIYDSGRSAPTYLSNKKGALQLTEPPLTKEYANIKQFLNDPLHLNYPSHTQSVERGVKLTTSATGRIAGQKRQIGEALCTIEERKKPWIGKEYRVTRKSMQL